MVRHSGIGQASAVREQRRAAQMEQDSQFTAFVREHSDALHRSAWLLVGERAGAADLVQETLTRLYPR